MLNIAIQGCIQWRWWNVMAIKTREFLTETGDTFGIDVYINQFLMSGYVEQLIDIKYQLAVIDVGSSSIIRTSALVIYKGD